MFFTDERTQFFRPLTGKYREQVAECLRLLHERLYSSHADYGESLRREQVLDVFTEALERAPLLEGEDEGRFSGNREQAGWILNQLVEHGWLKRDKDEASFQSTYPFSRTGRLFTQTLAEVDGRSVRTRHRNTRNTLNALAAFLERGEAYDLLDAHEHSERIIADFTDIIGELEERKRELVREVEAQQLVQQASDQFFDFMEKRFQPDVAIRLSADSVEKHRERIHATIGKIRRKQKAWKANAERELRRLAPDLVVNEDSSVLWQLLDSIELRMRNASQIMLPALRRTLQGFTRRADIIIRQLSYLHSQRHNDIAGLCRELSELDDETFARRLAAAGEALAGLRVTLVDPGQNRLRERRPRRAVHSRIAELDVPDEATRRELLTQQLLEKAFNINSGALRDYLRGALGASRRIDNRDLPINSAADLLALSHVIELGSADHAEAGFRLRLEPTEAITGEHYFARRDGYLLELDYDDDTSKP
ncbi:Wadjet anti-phage system protein JetA family protein [Parahaliea mediterranea]|uniref:Flagellar protein FliT n=1 Tax=Parahaliea mediterranea TaxID=651086 RepID=A0A939DEP2_9GAMM|nr:Wadjet anti-phage system protein JetA family protein [Parahaliea mediterranea]MBN7796750.1 flagellar protein FliT [Parahaliea mediterranea]